MILTAGHIANDAGISELEFFLRASGTINWDSEGRATDVSHRVALEIEQIALCTSEDLAAIVLRPNAARVDFLTLNEDTFSSPPVGANVLLFGHPADGTFEVARIQVGPGIQNMIMACRPAAFIGAIVQAPERPLSGFDAREHLLVEFEPRSEGRTAFGYSGSGVWHQHPGAKLGAQDRSFFWSPEPVLAGVETHAYCSSGLVRVVKAGIVRQFLEDVLP